MRADLIHDLQGLLLAAFELGDYNSVKKFAGYLEDLTSEEKASAKAKPGRPKKSVVPVKPVKAPKARKLPKAEKIAKVAKVAKAVEAANAVLTADDEVAPKKAPKGKAGKKVKEPKKAKAPKKVKAPKAPKALKVEGAKRGAAKFEPGTKLGANFKGDTLEMTVVEGGFAHGETIYPTLRALVDAVAGPKQAMHLRYVGNWKVIA